jgi:hypothetical protein
MLLYHSLEKIFGSEDAMILLVLYFNGNYER